MIQSGYKLVRKRKDGTYGPLFINRKLRIPIGIWLKAEPHRTKGFAFRPGWHICEAPVAPHLSKEGRVWLYVVFRNAVQHKRPKNQGGVWWIANEMEVLCEL